MSKSAARLVEWLLGGAFVLTLIGYAYLGSHSRYMADDYSPLRAIRTHGFFRAQINWYQAWTGRFSFTFVNSLMTLLGPTTPRFVPGVLLTLWFAAAVWATYQIYSLSDRLSWTRVVVFAGFIVFATLESAPNVYQSLYWQTGALTYVAPFIPLSFCVGVINRGVTQRHNHFWHRFQLACAGILMFIAGGFSDAYVVLQTCGLIVTICLVELSASMDFKTRMRPFLLAGFIGSVAALTIVALAPGNGIRQTYFPKQYHGWAIGAVAILYSLRFVAKLILTHPGIFITSLMLPLLFALRDLANRAAPISDRRPAFRLLLIIPLAVLLLITCCTATSIYAISVMLPERARILLSLTFICGTFVWSWAASEYLTRYLHMISSRTKKTLSVVATVALLLLIICPQITFFSILGVGKDARAFAADWDRQDSELRVAKQNGVTDVTVPQIGDFQSRIGKGPSDLHLRTDPRFWINQTTATYYGLRSVRASEDVATAR